MKKNNNNITLLVPVKKNSERVKSKNLRKFAGSSLYKIKLNQLKKVKQFSSIVISSEDKKILDYANNKGFKTHYRDSYYSSSKVPMSEVYSYIASEIDGENIAWVNITNPLIESFIYDYAAKKYISLPKNKFDCLLSSVINKQNYFYNNKPVNFKPYPWPRSQDLKPLISLPFVINILKRKKMIEWGSCVGKKPYFLHLNPLLATDIDDKSTFDLCETLYQKKFFKKLKKKEIFEKI